jgi:hypothetical protein
MSDLDIKWQYVGRRKTKGSVATRSFALTRTLRYQTDMLYKLRLSGVLFSQNESRRKLNKKVVAWAKGTPLAKLRSYTALASACRKAFSRHQYASLFQPLNETSSTYSCLAQVHRHDLTNGKSSDGLSKSFSESIRA